MSDESKPVGLSVTKEERTKVRTFEGRGKFELTIPLPIEKVQIVSNTSRLLGGSSLESVRSDDFEVMRMIATLNFVITNAPSWWTNAGECPDEDFLVKLWNWYLDEEKKFSDFLKKK
jgi:hypothetical protein